MSKIDDIFNECASIDETIEEIVPSFGSMILIECDPRNINYLRPYIMEPEIEKMYRKLDYICKNGLKESYRIIKPDKVKEFPLFRDMRSTYISKEMSHFDAIRKQHSINDVFYFIIQLNEKFSQRQFVRFFLGLLGRHSLFFTCACSAFRYEDASNTSIIQRVVPINEFTKTEFKMIIKSLKDKPVKDPNNGIFLITGVVGSLYLTVCNKL